MRTKQETEFRVQSSAKIQKTQKNSKNCCLFFIRRSLSTVNCQLLTVFCAILPLLSCILAGCGAAYNPSPVMLPPHIKKIAVRPFENKTQFFGLEEKLWLRVTEEFVRDGRLPYTSNEQEADGVVAGEITRYILEPVSYDVNHVVQEYKLWVLIDLKFIDRVNNVVLWEEPRMEQTHRYLAETAQSGGITEDEAREIIWDSFARDIVRRTIEGFGSVTGASGRKVE